MTEFGQEAVHAAVMALYHEPSRAGEANAYLLAFQNCDSVWNVGMGLLSSPQPEVALFAACCLHQKAKSSVLPADQLHHQCEALLRAIGQATQPAVRAQLCLAAAALGSSLEAGVMALARSASFAALPPQAQVELIGTLPQACPQHHERLRPAMREVMALLQHHSRPDAPAQLAVASCCKSWSVLGFDLHDLSSGPLLTALTLGLRCPAPLCEVCSEVLCEAMEVSTYPPSDSMTPTLQKLIVDLVQSAPHCLPPVAPEGTSLALATVLGAAVSVAPEMAAGISVGEAASAPAEIMLRLSSLPNTQLMEELAPAWGKLADADVPQSNLGTIWRSLADATLRQAMYPEDSDAGGREIDWESISSAVEESDFVRLRRLTIFELWQSIALAVPAVELVSAIAGALNEASAWRQIEAALFALQCITPAILPPPTRIRPGLASSTPPETIEQAAVSSVLNGVVSGVVALPAHSHGSLLCTALRVLGCLAPWFGHPSRIELLQQSTHFMLAALADEVAEVRINAADAFATVCSQSRCVDTLTTPQLLSSVSIAVISSLDSPRCMATPKVSQTALSALMRLIVHLPGSHLAPALDAVCTPLISKLGRLSPQLHDASNGPEVISAILKEIEGPVKLLECIMRYLDAAPLLPNGRHASLHVLQVCWPTLEMVRQACVNTKAKGFGFPEAIATALCEVYTAASRSGRSALGASVGQILSAIKGILATEFHGDSARSALLAFATIVEVFGNTKAAQHECCQLFADVSASVGAWLLVPGQIDEAQELAVSYLDLLYRSAIFCPQLIFSDPSIVKGALELLALSLRHSERELLRTACSVLARVACHHQSLQLAPHLATLAQPLLSALLTAISSDAPLEILPRVAEALRAVLQCCSSSAQMWLAGALLAERVRADESMKQRFVQLALQKLNDENSFRVMVCDFAVICRAAVPPPREALNTADFLL